MNNELMFSSESNLWSTPQDFFNKYNRIYNFEIDVCAIAENAKCITYFTPEIDGLKQEWNRTFWMNPPYGREIGTWIKYAYEQHLKYNVTGVLLLPARTDTRYFHDWCIKGEIEFIKGRLKFSGHKNPAPFPSMIVIFKSKSVLI